MRVEAFYPFDWEAWPAGARDIDGALAPLLAALPGALAEDAGFRWWSRTEVKAPFLWTSVEPSGLLVGGVIPKRDWHAWRAAFEQKTAEIPLRSGTW